MSEREIVIPISKIKSKHDSELEEKFKSEVDFQISQIEDDVLDDPKSNMKVSSDGQILVKFPKFIQLIATHEFEEIMEKHKHEDVIISSDLLVDLAGTTPVHDEPEDNRFSYMFLGLVLGLVVGAIVFLFFLK
jgi:hypothetical protein